MPRILRKLTITNVDRTWKGKNPAAAITLFKATIKDPDKETIMFVLEDADAEVQEFVAGLQATLDGAATAEPTEEAIAAAVAKALQEMTPEQIVEAVEGVEITVAEEPDLSEISKGLSPEVQAEIAKGVAAADDLAIIKAERRTEKFVAVAKADMSGLTETADDVGGVLGTVADALGEDSDLFKSVTRMFKSASAQSDEAMKTLGSEMGGAGHSGGDEVGAVWEAAEAYGETHGITKYAALIEIQKSQPKLVQAAHDES